MLDEPTNALDQNGVVLIREIVMQEKDRGALVLLASHNPDDLSMLADKLFEIENGKLLCQ